MKKELLKKFLNDQCSEVELQQVISWVKTKALKPAEQKFGEDEWKEFTGDENLPGDEKLNTLLDKIHHKINVKHQLIVPIKSKTTIGAWFTRAAAILLFPALGLLAYTMVSPSFELRTFSQVEIDSVEIVAPIGSKTFLQLADGTEVYLNHGSKLKYPQTFIGNTREVKLSGEGYFKVAHNPQKPFIVNVRNINIKALGTAFNVLAYPDEDVIETTLVNGKVVLGKLSDKGKVKAVAEMVPGQHISYSSDNGRYLSTKGTIEKYISWKDGKLIFKNDPIDQIALKLSRWYNVDIVFEDEKVREYTYTATFVDETLTQILDLMKLATPINYNVQPRKKLPDGIYSKQKIIIELK